MIDTEIKCILETLQKRLQEDLKDTEEVYKILEDDSISYERRLKATTLMFQLHGKTDRLRYAIGLIKNIVEQEKLFKQTGAKQYSCQAETNHNCNCEKNHNKEIQEQSSLDIKDIIREGLLTQLKKLVNQNQADAITDLECSLGDRGIKDKEIYQIFKYRLEGVIHVINKTEYEPEKSGKIVETIRKLYESKIL